MNPWGTPAFIFIQQLMTIMNILQLTIPNITGAVKSENYVWYIWFLQFFIYKLSTQNEALETFLQKWLHMTSVQIEATA